MADWIHRFIGYLVPTTSSTFSAATTEQAKSLALAGSDKCNWVTPAARSVREELANYGTDHPLGRF